MNAKSKLFSLLLVCFLLLPILLIAPQSNKSGQVLGDTEVANSSSSLSAEIGSGVREVRNPNSSSSSAAVNKISGNIIWDENQTVEISTNKFNLGKSIVVQTPKGDLRVVVNAIRPDLAAETVMVVNRETFIRLGGDPEKDTNIVASAWEDK